MIDYMHFVHYSITKNGATYDVVESVGYSADVMNKRADLLKRIGAFNIKCRWEVAQ